MATPQLPDGRLLVVRIALRDGRLWVDAPKDVLTPELRAALAAQKEMLLALAAEWGFSRSTVYRARRQLAGRVARTGGKGWVVVG